MFILEAAAYDKHALVVDFALKTKAPGGGAAK